MRARRQVSAPYREFSKEIDYLLRLDTENQNNFSSGPVGSGQRAISKRQLDLLSEGLFLAGFRAFENLIEDLVLLYAMGKPSIAGRKAVSYLSPRSFGHCRDIVKSTSTYLDWGDADGTIKRAELVLKDGEPIKSIIASNKTIIRQVKYIRNHIAHRSVESQRQYEKVLRSRLGTVPVKVPSAGEFLNMRVRETPTNYYLIEYLNSLGATGRDLAN